MVARSALLMGAFVFLSAGCSSTGWCNWWGRNTDGSNNLGRKPSPIQQGPIAGTYSRPGNETTAPLVQPPGATTPPPVVTTIPPTSSAPSDSSSPLMAPPTPPQGVVPSQYQPQSNNGVLPPNQLPPAGLTMLPENKPSINSPEMPTVLVPMPQVQAPTLDLTLPGAANAGSGSPTPLVLAPMNTPSSERASTTIAPPSIEMPAIAAPNVGKPVEIAPPKGASVGKAPSLNPGTTPPPLPAMPTPPVFDKK